MIWKVREGGLGSTAWVPGPPDTWPGWEDSAVPPEKVGPYLRDLRKLFDKYGYKPSLYGHFGQGCIHCRVGFDLYTADGIEKFKQFMDEAADLVVRYGGSLSGEHGDGQARGEYLPKMFGQTLYQAFREFKSIWDPAMEDEPRQEDRRLRVAENLRIGADYNPPQPATHFHFPTDKHSFSRAALRCVGVGECRREGGQIMCPSYMVTREEKDSHARPGASAVGDDERRGADRRLEERGGQGRPRPVPGVQGLQGRLPRQRGHGHLQGRVSVALLRGTAAAAPRLLDGLDLLVGRAGIAGARPGQFFSQTPGLSAIAKWVGGIDPRRRMPAFARQTFKEWFRRRTPPDRPDAPPVILWPDTFNNHFTPRSPRRPSRCWRRPADRSGCRREPVLRPAAVRLRHARPGQDLPAGILETLRPQIQAGIPVVGLEPSCLAVFRDEMLDLFPNDEDAKRLQQADLPAERIS